MITASQIYHAISSDYGSMEKAEKLLQTKLADYRDNLLTEAKQAVEAVEEGYYDTFYAGKEAAITAITDLRDRKTAP